MKKSSFLDNIAEMVIHREKQIIRDLKMADIKISPKDYVKKAVVSGLGFGLFISLFLVFALDYLGFDRVSEAGYFILSFVLSSYLFFRYFLLYAKLRKSNRAKLIAAEMVYSVRHIIVSLNAGIPLFDTLVAVSRGYGEAGKEFKKIIEKVSFGTPMSQAFREVAEYTPSLEFKRVVLQISNAISAGSNVSEALRSIASQISKEHEIKLKEYGQKLTPFVMFYMIFGIVMPALGIVFVVILFSFFGVSDQSFKQYLLPGAFALVFVIQFLFYSLIDSSRPRYGL